MTVNALAGVVSPGPLAHKDWLHFNVFHHASGCVGLVNATVHGPPDDPKSRAVGTALLHVPGEGWVGNTAVKDISEARLGPHSVLMPEVGIAVGQQPGRVDVSARMPDEGFSADVIATAIAPGLDLDEAVAFGSGWISWSVLPRLALTGSLQAAGMHLQLDGADGYHDRNWGRWHWGEDAGWEWGCFMAPEPGPAITLARITDRVHRQPLGATLIYTAGGHRRMLRGPSVRLSWSGRMASPERRVPGAMAALHQDRARPRLPSALGVRAWDGVDLVEVEFVAASAVQVIVADPFRRGYGFIHELAGSFKVSGRVGGAPVDAGGLAVVEYVD